MHVWSELEAVSRSATHIHRGATHIHRGATHTEGATHWVHPHRAKTIPNFLKFLVTPHKLIGRLYDMTCSSKFINDMVVYGYV